MFKEAQLYAPVTTSADGTVTVELDENQTISAVVIGQFAGLRDALIEDGLRERPNFEGAPDNVRGWTPGVATGPGFEK